MSTVYIIGAGISGLAAAKRLSEQGEKVIVFESTDHPGGRCRTFYDEKLGLEIDNANHLVLSSNSSILEMADASQLYITKNAAFDFIDLKSNSTWTVDGGGGKIPWLHKKPPGANTWNLLNDYRKLNRNIPIADALDASSIRWNSFWLPLVLAVMNTPANEASAKLMHNVLSETLLRGGYYARPVFTLNGLSKAFVEPVAGRLDIRYGATLKGVKASNNKASKLIFRDQEIDLKTDDALIVALPWAQAHNILPSLPKPPEFNPIINVHFKTNSSVQTPQMTGLIGSHSHWLFRHKNVASVTISAANQLAQNDSDIIARLVWSEVGNLLGGGNMPEYRVIKEKSATFSASPKVNAIRPSSASKLENLFIAGDWVATGLPATLEGAARSGFLAADALRMRLRS
ncbi:MAG: hydroxysqualene dehydroxylase HpnE [Rhodospirillaceae bacterium]|nr:hydroxysqualene dehydroxylase HpnE [Rhodospirillaceae bacterium]